MNSSFTRRDFLRTTATTATLFTILPERVRGAESANNKLNIAGIGVGGMGRVNLQNL